MMADYLATLDETIGKEAVVARLRAPDATTKLTPLCFGGVNGNAGLIRGGLERGIPNDEKCDLTNNGMLDVENRVTWALGYTPYANWDPSKTVSARRVLERAPLPPSSNGRTMEDLLAGISAMRAEREETDRRSRAERAEEERRAKNEDFQRAVAAQAAKNGYGEWSTRSSAGSSSASSSGSYGASSSGSSSGSSGSSSSGGIIVGASSDSASDGDRPEAPKDGLPKRAQDDRGPEKKDYEPPKEVCEDRQVDVSAASGRETSEALAMVNVRTQLASRCAMHIGAPSGFNLTSTNCFKIRNSELKFVDGKHVPVEHAPSHVCQVTATCSKFKRACHLVGSGKNDGPTRVIKK